jgi:sRNA-binding carbon storage regulator CsrA
MNNDEPNKQTKVYAEGLRMLQSPAQEAQVFISPRKTAAQIGTEVHDALLKDGEFLGRPMTEPKEYSFEWAKPAVDVVAASSVEDIARRLGIENVYATKALNAELGHLSLTRRQYESVRIGNDTVVTVLKVRADSIALGFEYAGLRSGSKNVMLDSSVDVGTPEGTVSIRVAQIKGLQARLHFEADRSIKIVRTELL